MENVKSLFSIKDLENLSGIKAHTIRIWEKRYNILEPMRTESNIRYYDLSELQKLLNITLLHDHGYKISKISKYPAERIPMLVREIVTEKSAKSHAINAFKMAMMNFDQTLFFNTYNSLLSEKTFREVFHEVFIPLLKEIGLLWQTDTITPAHEHFISHLIRQKLMANTEKIMMHEPVLHDKVFVLYLPMNEIHELGLMFLNYEILLNGYKSIYLGESVPISSLKDLKKLYSSVTFVSYWTIEPSFPIINDYISALNKELLNDDVTELWLLGTMIGKIQVGLLSNKTLLFYSIKDLVKKL